MSRCCDIFPEKKTVKGNNVSHSNRKVKRTFKSNIHSKTYALLDEETGNVKKVKMKLSTKAIRLIDKYGLKEVLEKFAC
ncbi:MAG: 50S ribosomal protein L28 [Pseudomonadota bacterium]|nr:50S ribosomal protein L28 [Pseudomonadota bacterium]